MSTGIYRPCVGITLINNNGEIFIGERIDQPGAWQMPQGGIDPGEDLSTAFFREMWEETGTRAAEILEIYPEVIRYDFPPGKRNRLYNGAYDGQEQTWIAARFTGTDDDINLHVHNPAEFRAWRWCKPMELLELIIPFKRPTYQKILSKFKPHLIG